jgi:enoyl-CoA hydratase/carnithine racemase
MSSSSSCEHIELIKISPSHWELIFNRPEKYNAITSDMYECITRILDDAENDEELILLSITGKGKFYSSGTDLSDPTKLFVRLIFFSFFFHFILLLNRCHKQMI